MAEASAEKSTPADPGGQLHPSLLGIAAAMEKSENERRQRMSLAQEFLGIIDAWAKTKAETEEAALVVPFIDRIAPIVTAMATGSAHSHESPCKTLNPNVSTMTTAAPRVTKSVENVHHALPKKPQQDLSPWVTVARRTAKLPNPTVSHTPQKQTLQTTSTTQSTPNEDKRIFLRLGAQHEWRKLSPVTLKKIITERAGVAASAITTMYTVRSGFAIECVSDSLRDSILSASSLLKAEEATIEPASNWVSVIVPHVPIHIRTLHGTVLVTNEMVANECFTVCGAMPEKVRPTKAKPGQFSTSWLIHFKQKPAKLGFRLFDESEPAFLFSRRRPMLWIDVIRRGQRLWLGLGLITNNYTCNVICNVLSK